MGTRCNIVLKVGKTVTYLYRHYDGYPAETGADILAKAEAACQPPSQYLGAQISPTGAAGKFLAAILAAAEEPTEHRPEPRRTYELTNDLHGDIQHVYYVIFSDKGTVIEYGARPKAKEWDETDKWARRTSCVSYNRFDDFRKLVNADRTDMNARLAELKAKGPSVYSDCAEYPMV